MNDKIKVRAVGNPLTNATELYIVGDTHIGEVTMRETDHAYTADAALKLKREEAVQLMDDLWQAGVRPTDLPDKVRHLIGTNDLHLRDMRKIVSKYLEVSL